MKILLGFFLLSFSASVLAIDITFDEAIRLMDQAAPTLNKVEVGETMQEDSFEMHGECILHEKSFTTIVEITAPGATLLKDVSFENSCTGEKWAKKYVVLDEMITWEKVRKEMVVKFKSYPVFTLLGTLIKFEQDVNGVRHTYHYDTKFNLFMNWTHHHYAYAGVEDHNPRNPLPRKIIALSELAGLPLCKMDMFTHDIVSCQP